MNFIEIAEGLIINIEHIYSLSIVNNRQDIENWDKTYSDYIEHLMKTPIPFDIDGEEYIPDFDEKNDQNKLNEYMKKLNEYIISCIGEKPGYIESYVTILNTGANIKISKNVYDFLYNYIKEHLIK